MTRAMAKKKRKAGRAGAAPAPAAIQFSAGALRLAVAGLVVLFSLFAWSQRGMYEDGFFFLRVVDVFLHGGGLAYNPGERFETNTDFLWTLLLIPGIAVGIDDILWLQLLGVLTYAAALWATFALVRRMFPDSDAALVALVLLGTHFSFAHFAATGFAPVLQALATVCCLLGLWRFGEKADVRGGAALGFALSFLALCRLDSAVFGVSVVLCALFLAWRAGKSSVPGLAVALAIPSVLFGGTLLWKLWYYGDILPATYYAKAAPASRPDLAAFFLKRGAWYVVLYWERYFLWVPAAAVAFGAWRTLKAGRKKREDSPSRPALLWTAAAMCGLWNAYMLRVGGDYNEFRLLVPQAPMLALLAAAGLRGLARNWRWATAAAAAVFSLLHWQTAPPQLVIDEDLRKLGGAAGSGVTNSAGTTLFKTELALDGGLRSRLLNPEEGDQLTNIWHDLGVGMRDLFAPLGAYPPEVRVASPFGGATAHIAPLLWTEMRGFADSRIGLAGAEDLWLHVPSIGHSIMARPRLLKRLGVNLVHGGLVVEEVDFSRPRFAADNPRLTWAMAASHALSPEGIPPESQLFALPLPGGRFTPVLYFNRNAVIDGILDERGIERVDVF